MKIAVIADYQYSAEVVEKLGIERSTVSEQPIPTGTLNLTWGLASIPEVELHHICLSRFIESDQVIEHKGLKVHFLRVPPKLTSLSLLQYPRLRVRSELQKIKPDIVHGHHAETGYAYYALTSGYVSLAGIHNYLPLLLKKNKVGLFKTLRIFQLFEAYTISHMPYLTVDSFWMKELISKKSKGKVYRIPNCVSEIFFNHESKSETDAASMIAVGVTRPEKGLTTLLKALAIVKEKYSNCILKIVGKFEPDVKIEIDKLVTDLNICKNVKFMGWLNWEKIVDEMCDEWCVVVPSLYEPFGCTAIEGMAMGKAVIGSNVGGIAENITDGETGVLFEAGNDKELAQKILTLFSNKALRQKLGINAARSSLAHYHPAVVAGQHIDLYKEILASLK
jgi:glycosyltransferase involved in cell wall biosynthesis